jgi:hypothetical protein
MGEAGGIVTDQRIHNQHLRARGYGTSTGRSRPKFRYSVNINMHGHGAESPHPALEVPFLLSVNFSPAIASVSVKGKAKVTGDAGSLKRVMEDYSQRRPPPIQLIQAISNTAMAEAILMSRSLGIPPPLPPLPQPPGAQRPGLDMKYTS